MRTSTVLIGLGLLLGVMVAASLQAEAQMGRSPFEQLDEPGQTSKGLVPVVIPKARRFPAAQPAGQDTPEPELPGPESLRPGGPPPLVPDRIVIPAIKLDAPIRPATLKEIQYQGKTYQQWVAPAYFAAGQVTTSAPPGTAGNLILIGHHNIYGEVFGRLLNLNPGDAIVVYAGAKEFHYAATQKLILREAGEPLQVKLKNALWIGPSQEERLTLVTCWPNDDNTHRLILVAAPLPGGGP